MSHVMHRRVRLALGFWGLLRRESRLCRWFPAVNRLDDRTGVTGGARWLGNVRIGRRSHHALLITPPSEVTYRMLAGPHARLEAWCGLLPDAGKRNSGNVEFAVKMMVEEATQPITGS